MCSPQCRAGSHRRFCHSPAWLHRRVLVPRTRRRNLCGSQLGLGGVRSEREKGGDTVSLARQHTAKRCRCGADAVGGGSWHGNHVPNCPFTMIPAPRGALEMRPASSDAGRAAPPLDDDPVVRSFDRIEHKQKKRGRMNPAAAAAAPFHKPLPGQSIPNDRSIGARREEEASTHPPDRGEHIERGVLSWGRCRGAPRRVVVGCCVVAMPMMIKTRPRTDGSKSTTTHNSID